MTWSAGQCFVFKSLYQMIKTGAQDFHQDKLRVKTCLAILIGISIGHRGHFLPGSSIHCQVKSRYRSRSETGRHLHHIIRMVVVWYKYKVWLLETRSICVMNDARLTLDITSGPTYQLLRYQSSIMYCLVKQQYYLSLVILKEQ